MTFAVKPLDVRSRKNRWLLLRALRRYCKARGVSRAELARRLNAPYQTVACWWPERTETAKRSNAPSAKWARRVQEVFPEIADGFAEVSGAAAGPQRVEIRLRSLRTDLTRKVSDAAVIAADKLAPLEKSLPESMRTLWLTIPDSPGRMRERLGLGGVAPVRSVEIAVERLGVPVVKINESLGADQCATLVRTPRPVIVVGRSENEADERFAIVSELGFLCVDPDLRAAPRRHAVNEFADDFLVPIDGIRTLLLPSTKAVDHPTVWYLASVFGVPPESVLRQCSRARIATPEFYRFTLPALKADGYLASLSRLLGDQE